MKRWILACIVGLIGICPLASAAVRTVSIVDKPGGDFDFVPRTIFATAGDTIKWVNNSSGTHTVTSGISPTPDGGFDSGVIGPAGTFQRRFPATGPTRYFCQIHTNMTGLVRVTRAVVTISGFAFSPATLTVNKGDSVVGTTTDADTHTSTSG